MYLGNVEKVMAEAAEIARQFRDDGVRFEELKEKYHSRFGIIKRAILTKISIAKYQQLVNRRRSHKGKHQLKILRTSKPYRPPRLPPTRFVMRKQTAKTPMSSILSPFTYTNGYELNVIDGGKGDIKIELGNSIESCRAIILPVKKAEELQQWMKMRNIKKR